MRLRSTLACTAAVPRPETFEHFCSRIDPAWIQDALEATGTASMRRRRLPAEQVIWLVLGMALFRDRCIAEVAESLNLTLPGRRGPAIAPSAVAQCAHWPGLTGSAHSTSSSGASQLTSRPSACEMR